MKSSNLIVHIIDRLPPDGAERLIAEVLKNRSSKYKYQVLCLVDGGELVREIEDNGVEVTILGRRNGHDLVHAYRLFRWLRKHRPLVVHTHLFTADAWGRSFAWLARVPGIYSTVHSTNTWKSKTHLLVDWILAFVSDAVIACTDEVKSKLISQGIPNRKLISIANGVDLNRIDNTPATDLTQEFSISLDKPVFALVGRLHEAKGHSDLIPVLNELVKEGADFHCLFVGEGELEDQLRHMVSDMQLQEKITFCGFRRDVIGIMKAVDFLVMPSRWEGLPISLLEAMACASPVVASRVGGIPDVIDHQSDGLLYTAGNATELKTRIEQMLEHKEARQSMAVVGEKKIRDHYSAASVSEAYENLYDKTLHSL